MRERKSKRGSERFRKRDRQESKRECKSQSIPQPQPSTSHGPRHCKLPQDDLHFFFLLDYVESLDHHDSILILIIEIETGSTLHYIVNGKGLSVA